MDGTIRALAPIVDDVLVWVARERRMFERLKTQFAATLPDLSVAGIDARLDEVRRIELCALVARDVSAFEALYGQEEKCASHSCPCS